MEEKYIPIYEIVEKELSCSGHNIEHIIRVYHLSKYLAKFELDVNMDVMIPAALLHDIARVKEDTDKTGSIDHAVLGAEIAGDVLNKLGYEKKLIPQIKDCIKTHRFRSNNHPKSIEAKILFDADKLDCIGAVGIARLFMIAGQYGEKMYSFTPMEQYKEENITENGRLIDISKHAPNIEFEILKTKVNRLYTSRAKELAKDRMKFMEKFFKNLDREITGAN